MQNPETTTIYLSNGEQVQANVNGISPDDGSGYVLIEGRDVKVAPLPDMWEALGYGEVVSITLQEGNVIEMVLEPNAYYYHTATLYLDGDALSPTICILDNGSWRELTDEEYERVRRAEDEDAKDMAQIEREWRDYRNEGLGKQG